MELERKLQPCHGRLLAKQLRLLIPQEAVTLADKRLEPVLDSCGSRDVQSLGLETLNVA